MGIATILTMISLAFGVVKFGGWVWSVTGSESAQLKRLQGWLAAQQARLVQERITRAAADAKIDAAPDKPLPDVVDDLNTQFGGGKKP